MYNTVLRGKENKKMQSIIIHSYMTLCTCTWEIEYLESSHYLAELWLLLNDVLCHFSGPDYYSLAL